MSEVSDKLINLIADMEEDEAVELAPVSLDGGMPPAEMLEICRSAMDIVGKRFEDQVRKRFTYLRRAPCSK